MTRKRVILAIVVALLAGLGLVVLLLKMTPDAYRRTVGTGIETKAIDRFNEEVVNRVGNVFLDRSRQTPLQLHLTEDMINARLALALEDLARTGKTVPPVLRDARIAFEPGRIVLATRLGQGATAAIVSQAVRLAIGPDGGLVVQPGGTSVGLLPMPLDIVGATRPLLAAEADRLEQAGDTTGNLEVLRAVVDAIDGKSIPLGNGKKRIVLDRIEIGRGVLEIDGHQAGRVEKPADTPTE
jgi:hypothetical protein